MVKKKDIIEDFSPKRSRRRPAETLDSRENQLVSYAIDLAEQQLLDGTASAQVITHYLKLGTTRERLEKEKMELELELIKAKTESYKSAKRIEELYANAMNAMKSYSSNEGDYEIDEDAEEDVL